ARRCGCRSALGWRLGRASGGGHVPGGADFLLLGNGRQVGRGHHARRRGGGPPRLGGGGLVFRRRLGWAALQDRLVEQRRVKGQPAGQVVGQVGALEEQ